VKTVSLNHHDLWSLKGISVHDLKPPLILGLDGAGTTDDGREVVLYPMLELGQRVTAFSDNVDGTLAPRIMVPSANILPKPAHLSWEEASCLGTAWMTAWHMLFTRGRLRSTDRVLVQGATGGVSTAAIALASALGCHVTATSRSETARDAARGIGAADALPSGTPLANPVDLVIETVGEATWEHTASSLAQKARVVVAGATTGFVVPLNLFQLFVGEQEIIGATAGTADEMRDLLMEDKRIHPAISQVYEGLESTPDALSALAAGNVFGKLVIRVQE
jgi:NADPH:quinone reductase-like Zn-dependent oxidoreductase